MEIKVVLRFDPDKPQERAEAAAIVRGDDERLRAVLRDLRGMLERINAGTWPFYSGTDAITARAADQLGAWLSRRLHEEGLSLGDVDGDHG